MQAGGELSEPRPGQGPRPGAHARLPHALSPRPGWTDLELSAGRRGRVPSLAQPQRKWGKACGVSRVWCRPALAPRTEVLDAKCQVWLDHMLGVRHPASVSLSFLLDSTASGSVCLLMRLRHACKVLLIRLWEPSSSRLRGEQGGWPRQPRTPKLTFQDEKHYVPLVLGNRKLTFQKNFFYWKLTFKTDFSNKIFLFAFRNLSSYSKITYFFIMHKILKL